jgi:hypothetical protein
LASPTYGSAFGSGEHHVEALAEPLERFVELGTDILGFKNGHAGIEVVLVLHPDEEPDDVGVTGLKPRQFVCLRRHRCLHVRGSEDGQGLGEGLGDAPVVNDQAERFAVSGPVHAGDGLKERVFLQRRVQVHHLLDRGVEAREEHVADDEDLERIVLLQEAGDQLLALVLARVVLHQPLGVLVRARDDHGRLRAVEAVEGLLVEDCDLPGASHHLGLESVWANEAGEVVDDVEGDRLNPLRGPRKGLLVPVLLPDGLSLFLGSVSEDPVEEGVEGVPYDTKLSEPTFVEDRDGGPVSYGLLDRVRVDVRAERREGRPVVLVNGGSGEPEEGGVRQGLPHVAGEPAVLGSVGLIGEDENVLGLVEDRELLLRGPPLRVGGSAG